MAITSLEKSAPAQSLTPPPKAMKVLDPTCNSFPFFSVTFQFEQEKKN
jgi:hypothetical protein